MDAQSPSTAPSPVEIHMARASSVIMHRIPPERSDDFLEWQRGVTLAAQDFPGYRSTVIYPPVESGSQEWVTVVEFDSQESLRNWLDSTVREEWVSRLPREIADFRLKTLLNGFGPWFGSLVQGADEALPPSWKMFLTVLLGLYPTVMLLTLWVGPYTSPLGLSLSMLIGNALSVAILQWAVVPALTALLAPWLGAPGSKSQWLAAGGAVFILLLLGGIAALFHAFMG